MNASAKQIEVDTQLANDNKTIAKLSGLKAIETGYTRLEISSILLLIRSKSFLQCGIGCSTSPSLLFIFTDLIQCHLEAASFAESLSLLNDHALSVPATTIRCR